MPQLKLYSVFISHSWNYSDEYNRLVNLLNEAPNFWWRNYSVPKRNPLDTTDESLTNALKDQIRPAGIVVVLAGMYVAHSYWIQKEIDIAEDMDKPTIGVKPWGNQRVPQAVQDAAITVVGWNTDSIVEAIRKYSL